MLASYNHNTVRTQRLVLAQCNPGYMQLYRCIYVYPPTTDGVLDIKMLLTSLPVTLPQGHSCGGGGGSTYHAMIRRRFTKSVHCAGLLNSVCQKTLGCSIPPGCAFASSAAPAAHRQHHLHHPHQRLPRMRMMQVMLGMLPMLVGGKGGKDLNSERGGKDLREEREKIWGKMPEKALRGNGGTGSQTGKGEKDFGKRRVEILKGKGLRGETGERILSGKGGEKILGRQRETNSGCEKALGGTGGKGSQ